MAATNPSTDNPSPWGRWLDRQLRDRQWEQKDLIEASGGRLVKSTVSRWISGGRADLENVVIACEVLDVPITRFLVQAGYVDAEAAGIVVQHEDPATLNKRDLIARRRELDDEIDSRIPDAEAAEVTPLRPEFRPETLGEEWAARKRPPRK